MNYFGLRDRTSSIGAELISALDISRPIAPLTVSKTFSHDRGDFLNAYRGRPALRRAGDPARRAGGMRYCPDDSTPTIDCALAMSAFKSVVFRLRTAWDEILEVIAGAHFDVDVTSSSVLSEPLGKNLVFLFSSSLIHAFFEVEFVADVASDIFLPSRPTCQPNR